MTEDFSHNMVPPNGLKDTSQPYDFRPERAVLTALKTEFPTLTGSLSAEWSAYCDE